MSDDESVAGYVVAHDHDTGVCWRIAARSPDGVALLEWAMFHGLDPIRIPLHSVITRDAAGCRIIYQSFTYGPDDLIRVDVNADPLIEQRIEQGEAPPRPFPPFDADPMDVGFLMT